MFIKIILNKEYMLINIYDYNDIFDQFQKLNDSESD